MKSTHWSAFRHTEEWADDPCQDKDDAARQFLESSRADNDDVWEAWDELERYGKTEIELRGYLRTTELITDEAEQFDGYEPGCEWFKATEERCTVVVSLTFQVKR